MIQHQRDVILYACLNGGVVIKRNNIITIRIVIGPNMLLFLNALNLFTFFNSFFFIFGHRPSCFFIPVAYCIILDASISA